jgi:hypothetical protein
MPKWLPSMPLPRWNGDNDAMRDWVFYQLQNFYRAQREELLKEVIDPDRRGIEFRYQRPLII